MLIENVFVDDSGVVSVQIDGGLISEIGDGLSASSGDVVFDASGSTLFPGFIDVHNHGAVGVDVNEADVDGFLEIAGFLARKGVTAWVPTIVPDSDESYRRIISAIDRLMDVQVDRLIAQVVGVHYEGVFANEKMCGALRPEYFKRGQWTVDGGQLPRLKTGVHMTTLAPEIDGGVELIEALVGQGWIV